MNDTIPGFKLGDFVVVVHPWKNLRGRSGFIVAVNNKERVVSVWVESHHLDRETRASQIEQLGFDEVGPFSITPDHAKGRIKHEVYMADMRRGRAERDVLDAVEVLFKARKRVDDCDEEIKLIRSACSHDEERTGTAPAGSFTINHFMCRTCGLERSDD
jgi:hypothetical protein